MTREALSRGRDVIAIVRDRSRLTVTAPNLTVRMVDIVDPESVAKAVSGADVVVSAYGPGPDKQAELLQTSKSLIEIVKRLGLPWLITAGGRHKPGGSAGRETGGHARFPRRAERSPGRIHPAARTHRQIPHFDDQLITGPDGQSRISAEGFTVALIDEVERPRFLHQRFTAAY